MRCAGLAGLTSALSSVVVSSVKGRCHKYGQSAAGSRVGGLVMHLMHTYNLATMAAPHHSFHLIRVMNIASKFHESATAGGLQPHVCLRRKRVDIDYSEQGSNSGERL